MGASSESALPRLARIGAVVTLAVIFCWLFPLFRVVPLAAPTVSGAAAGEPAAPAVFEPASAAKKFWDGELSAARARAFELKEVLKAVRENSGVARTTFSKSSGMGAAYLFVRGSGKVIARERNVLHVAVDDAAGEIVALRIGPIFGNTVRDGTGLLDVNSFPGVQEFNALSAELNSIVEQQVLPLLREKGVVGASLHFTACGEAPESAADAGEPLLTLVPMHVEIRS